MTELGLQYGKNLRSGLSQRPGGSQHTREAFRTVLRETGLVQILSGTGDCFDNARMESFCDLEEGKIGYKLTQGQVKSIIFRYIFVYYNRIRISSVNPGEISPVTYREWAEANAQTVA